MKKTISLVLIFCLAVGLLSGCSFKRISSEEDIINMQVGGYLYTSQVRADTKDERNFLKEREKTVSEMINCIEKTADHSYSVTDGFSKYEDNLIKYIKKISDFDNDTSAIISAMLQKMTAYKVLLGSYEDQIRQFRKMKPDSIGVKSILNTYMWNAVHKLVAIQNEYLSWLTNNTGTIISLLGAENRQSERLLSTSESIYEKNISGAFEDMLIEYEAASLYNSIIQSSDYYASQFYFANAKENIQAIREKGETDEETLAELDEAYNNALKAIKKPPILIPAPDEQSFSLTRRVQAESDIEPIDKATVVLKQDIDEITKNPAYPLPGQEFKAALEKSAAESQSDYDMQMKAVTSKPDGAVELSLDADNASQSAADKRAEMIKNITRLQRGLRSSSLFLGEEVSYSAAVYAITKLMELSRPDLLTEDEKETLRDTGTTEDAIRKLDEQTIKTQALISQAVNLINTELESLIGDNVEQFFTLLTTKAADEFYNDFTEWKDEIGELTSETFTKENLENLLIKMGADFIKSDEENEASKPDTAPSSDTTENSSRDSESPVTSEPPVESIEPNLPTDSNETTDNFAITHITGFWQTIRELDPYLDNESILYTIYGWTDLLDYSKYEKKEILNKDGTVSRIQYMDASNNAVGWETRFYDETIEYSYHFPGDKDHDLEIIRRGSVEKNYMYQVSTEDETISRMSSIRFNEPGHPESEENIKIIAQRENGKRDGLNLTAYNSNPTYAIYDMEEMWESYTFKNGILIREMESAHKGSDIETSIKEYYDSGEIKHEFTELNDKEHGLYTAYYENGKVQMAANYNQGQYHGTVETFYEDGHTNDFTTYSDGQKDGIAYGYYSAEPHHMRYESEYKSGMENGVFKHYSVKGSLNTEIEFKDGIPDGIFRDYLVDDEIHTSSYHVFGQNENGKRVGIWEFGRNNIDWIERVYYEDGVKIWSEYADSKYRTYYNSDGSVNRTETKP